MVTTPKVTTESRNRVKEIEREIIGIEAIDSRPAAGKLAALAHRARAG